MTKPSSDVENLELSKFTDSFETFNRIINSLQRKYIELEEDFSRQHQQLVEANNRLVDLSRKNITATEFLNSILSSINAGVIAVDAQGLITHINPAAAAILGLPEQNMTGLKYRDIIPMGHPANANALRTVESRLTQELIEKKVELSSGTNIELSVTTSLLTDDNNNIVGAAEVFHDLTKLKRLEQELARLNTLAALGEMAATVAHQVRNPLTAIAGFASLLRNDIEDGDPRKNLVEKIISGVDNLNATVDTLLNYTKYEELNKTSINYEHFVKEAIVQYSIDHPDLNDKIKISCTVNTSDKYRIQLALDTMLYRQILFNILNNATEAMNHSGRIKININKLERRTALSRYGKRLPISHDETIVETIITDTGGGVETADIEKIFAPFFTTKTSGNGLGLAVSWKIIKTHGGDIFVVNRMEPPGASFYLLMPVQIKNEMENK